MWQQLNKWWKLQGLTSRLKLNLLTIAICVSMRDTLMDRIMDTLMDRIMQKSVFKGTQLLYSHALKGDLWCFILPVFQ